MTYLEFIKKYSNIDLYIVLFDELGYSNEEIIEKLQVGKGSIYNAKERVNPLLEALKNMDSKKVEYGNPDINAVIAAFKESFGTTSSSKYDRYAAMRLAAGHGADNVVKVIKALSDHATEPFAPAVNSVLQLEQKWVSVGKFLTALSDNGAMDLT